MKKNADIMITGASGFIGGHVAEHFVRQGENTHCLVRKDSRLDFIDDLDINIIHGDITDIKSLVRAFRGMDSVIHIAGLSRDWGSRKDFIRINIDGTLNVLKAAVECGIQKVIIGTSMVNWP